MSEAWKSVIDADLKDVDFIPSTPLADGTYNAFVSNVEAKTFLAGSKGLQVTFTVSDGDAKGRDIRDYYVIVLADGKINKSGPALTKRLMIECGLTQEQILKFKYPDFDSKAFGDFKKLLEQPVTIEVKSEVQKKGKNAGKSQARVKNIKQRAE